MSDYVRGGGVNCPLCGSGNLDGGPVEIEAGEACQRVSCADCHSEWCDVYTLDRFEGFKTNPTKKATYTPRIKIRLI